MPILSIIIGTPLVGLLLIMILPKGQVALARMVALLATGTAFVLSWSLLFRFDRETAALQFAERQPWVPELGMGYSLGIDGLSFPLVLLTTLVTVVAVLSSWNVTERVRSYFAWFMLLELSMLGVFVAQDWFLFYVFWEIGLIPMFFLIGQWGGERRNVATMSFFLYTLGGSIAMLLGIVALYLNTDPRTFDMMAMMQAQGGWSQAFQMAPFVAFFLGFAVKIPAFPLHGWLPLAHVEAPTPVSIILSAVMLKMGGYGLMRLGTLLPLGLEWFSPVLLAIGLVNIVYGALLAWRQTDLKSMVAFSSISHMGFVIVGVAALNASGFSGAALQMVTHGIITAGLFVLVGVIYERTHTREVTEFGGLSTRIPIFSVLMSLALLASMGMPGLAQFVSELLVLLGAFQRWGLYVVVAMVAILLTAAYSLRTIGRMFMGPPNPRWANISDIRGAELAAALPLAFLTFLLGLYPSVALNLMRATMEQAVAIFE
ncbi:MAG: complex I subunit 4 family protein [Gemmatimonadaceae bacterium]